MPQNRGTPVSDAERALQSSTGVEEAGLDEAQAKVADEAHGRETPGRTQGGGANMTEVAGNEDADDKSK